MFLAFWGSFLAVVVLTSQSHSAEGTRKCQFKRKHDVYYSPNASRSHGKILKRLNSSNEDECQRFCCGLHNCTLYMYSTLSSSNLHKYDVNCLLFFCRNNSLCHTRPLPGNITGISIIGTKQGDFGIGSMVNNGSKDVTITQASVSTIFMSKSPSDTFAKSHASQISPSSPTTSQISTTSVKLNHKKKFSESHTTPASLVISLIIGILFFGTILFLIGRRWSETCLRRGYSRVDYLLNDYD